MTKKKETFWKDIDSVGSGFKLGENAVKYVRDEKKRGFKSRRL